MTVTITSPDGTRRITLPYPDALVISVHEDDGSLVPLDLDPPTLGLLLAHRPCPASAQERGSEGRPFLEIAWDTRCWAYIDRRRVPFAAAVELLGDAIVYSVLALVTRTAP